MELGDWIHLLRKNSSAFASFSVILGAIVHRIFMRIELLHHDGKARRGRLQTPHGTIETPFFMTVATAAAVKGLEPWQVAEVGGQVLLGNTYHLHLRPGSDLIREAGGLHRFMNWDGPMLTDSGGFQVFSLARIRSIDEDGVSFLSHIDGKEVKLTPEESMRIQIHLGADMIMAFDECKAPDEKSEVLQSLERTTRWAKRSLEYVRTLQEALPDPPTPFSGGGLPFPALGQQLFGIVQGAIYDDLRRKSAEDLVKMGFDGYAIGGLSVGEKEEVMYQMVDYTLPFLPDDQPRYLMGVGTPVNIVETVARGVDMFDCVLPTRNARHGHMYTSQGMVNIRNAKYARDFTALDPNCACSTCRDYTRAYLRHLITSHEYLANPLLVRHNLAYYLQLMKRIREAIEEERFEQLRKEVLETFR